MSLSLLSSNRVQPLRLYGCMLWGCTLFIMLYPINVSLKSTTQIHNGDAISPQQCRLDILLSSVVQLADFSDQGQKLKAYSSSSLFFFWEKITYSKRLSNCIFLASEIVLLPIPCLQYQQDAHRLQQFNYRTTC